MPYLTFYFPITIKTVNTQTYVVESTLNLESLQFIYQVIQFTVLSKQKLLGFSFVTVSLLTDFIREAELTVTVHENIYFR
jgi:hypothetical protein